MTANLSSAYDVETSRPQEMPMKRPKTKSMSGSESRGFQVRLLSAADLADAPLASSLRHSITTTVEQSNVRGELSRHYTEAEVQGLVARAVQLEQHIQSREIYVALADGTDEVLGSGMVVSATGEVRQMYVRPAHQGRGVGRRILLEILAFARRTGLERLFLECPPCRVAWNARFGFLVCERSHQSQTSLELGGESTRIAMELHLAIGLVGAPVQPSLRGKILAP